MRSGRVAQRQLRIEELAGGSPRQGSTGARADTWQTFKTVRGYVRPISGKERRAAAQAQSELDTEIEIRWIEGIKGAGAMRVIWTGAPTVAYTIHVAIDPELRGKKLLLQCSSGVVSPEAVNA